MQFKKILIIQTAFLGDVILSTVLIEKLKLFYPTAQIDFLLNKGAEGLLENHPLINEVLIWQKKKQKYWRWFQLLKKIRAKKYDLIINVQRYAATALWLLFSNAKKTVGYDQSIFHVFFDHAIDYRPNDLKKPFEQRHEIDRMLDLVRSFTDSKTVLPKVYIHEKIRKNLIQKIGFFAPQSYICIAPGSAWWTKQLPIEKWLECIEAQISPQIPILLLGGSEHFSMAQEILQRSKRENIYNFAGKINLLESAALIQNAQMTYANDSGPLHLASATNANVTAVFCSTVPAYGFTPTCEKISIIETKIPLSCRPCGIHGHQKCPQKHFKCAWTIDFEKKI